MISILNNWTNRVLTSETDPTQMGRWSCVHLKGKKDKIISIYSAYRVPQDSLPGPLTAYAQQYKLLIDNDETDLRPRRRMIVDLIKEIKSKQEAGNQIILGIDANEILEPDGSPVKKHSITTLKRDCGLTDVFEYQHEQVSDTSIKKIHKIDHILVSQDVLPSVKRSGFLPWGAVMASDHRTGFLDLDTETLFGTIEDSTHSSSRILHTKYPKRTKKYREEVLDQFKKNNLFKAMQKLSTIAKNRGRWSNK